MSSSLFDPIFGATEFGALTSDHAWVVAMLRVEAALARAAAHFGVITDEDARGITSAATWLAEPGSIDITALGIASASGGNPVIPLVGLLRTAAAELGVPAAAVHTGATSQDILDTALVILCRSAGDAILASMNEAADAAADLAATHRDTPMAGRTLGQQALPTTFGAVAAGWCSALDRAASRFGDAVVSLPVQFGGAAGTLAALYPHGLDIADALATELALPSQGVPWHTDRTHIAELVGALAGAAGSISKPATDITLLAATEVGEVTEDAPGGSSAMPHKRNPVAAITARAAARRVPGLASTMLSSMDHEHQRAAGAWHAEWETLTDMLRLTGGAAHQLATSLTGLHVDAAAMSRNLDATNGMLLAERVTAALAKQTEEARKVVTKACLAGIPLDTDPAITAYLDPAAVRELLDPAQYLGHAGDIVDRVLQARKGMS